MGEGARKSIFPVFRRFFVFGLGPAGPMATDRPQPIESEFRFFSKIGAIRSSLGTPKDFFGKSRFSIDFSSPSYRKRKRRKNQRPLLMISKRFRKFCPILLLSLFWGPFWRLLFCGGFCSRSLRFFSAAVFERLAAVGNLFYNLFSFRTGWRERVFQNPRFKTSGWKQFSTPDFQAYICISVFIHYFFAVAPAFPAAPHFSRF